MTDTVDIARLLVNGRVGLSFRKFDKQVKQWIKTHYKHMAPYFYTSKRENIGERRDMKLVSDHLFTAGCFMPPPTPPKRHSISIRPRTRPGCGRSSDKPAMLGTESCSH